MKKAELQHILIHNYRCDPNDLKGKNAATLKELLSEYEDDSFFFPNGRDIEAEDEDGI